MSVDPNDSVREEAPKAAVDGTVASAVRHAEEILDHLGLLLMVRRDRAEVRLRRRLAGVLFVLVVVPAAFVAVGYSGWLVIDGLVGGATELFGGRVWLARLVVGLATLTGAGCATWLFVALGGPRKRRERAARYARMRERLVAKYGDAPEEKGP